MKYLTFHNFTSMVLLIGSLLCIASYPLSYYFKRDDWVFYMWLVGISFISISFILDDLTSAKPKNFFDRRKK